MSLGRGGGPRGDDEWCLINPFVLGARADVIFHHDRPVAPAPGPGSLGTSPPPPGSAGRAPQPVHGPVTGPGSGQVQPEIPALPVLLEPLSMDGVVVTADAMHTQVDTAE